MGDPVISATWLQSTEPKWTRRIKTQDTELKLCPFLWSPQGGSPPSVPLTCINGPELNCKTNNCVLRGRCRALNLISCFSSYATLAIIATTTPCLLFLHEHAATKADKSPPLTAFTRESRQYQGNPIEVNVQNEPEQT